MKDPADKPCEGQSVGFYVLLPRKFPYLVKKQYICSGI